MFLFLQPFTEENAYLGEIVVALDRDCLLYTSALLAGKSVCTSNKELVAKHGPELLEIAKARDINYLFEASCGGGIPIIRPLNSSLTADEIDEITGILNGTTNYILSKMASDGSGFDEALKEAQEKGYAEPVSYTHLFS